MISRLYNLRNNIFVPYLYDQNLYFGILKAITKSHLNLSLMTTLQNSIIIQTSEKYKAVNRKRKLNRQPNIFLKPLFTRPYFTPSYFLNEVTKSMHDMQKNNIVPIFSSSQMTPILYVNAKDKAWGFSHYHPLEEGYHPWLIGTNNFKWRCSRCRVQRPLGVVRNWRFN